MLKLIRTLKRKILGTAPAAPPLKRLVIHKAKWLHNATSPVCLMIDDLANAWVEEKGKDGDGPEYDWGGKHSAANSAFTFLQENLCRQFPQAKTVYFTLMGEMHSFNTKTGFA